jgi:hypothetical protein
VVKKKKVEEESATAKKLTDLEAAAKKRETEDRKQKEGAAAWICLFLFSGRSLNLMNLVKYIILTLFPSLVDFSSLICKKIHQLFV